MKRVLHFFSYVLIVLFSFPFTLLPYGISLKIGGMMGAVLFYFWRSRRTIAVDNLRAAVSRGAIKIDGPPEAVIKQNFMNLGKSFVEVVKIYFGFGKRILEHIDIKGIENFRKAQSKGAGVIFITGHCGNWELSALKSSKTLIRFNVVARAQNNPYLNRVIERTREKYGNNVIYKKSALKNILLALKRKEAVGILMDQSVVGSEGVVAEFLGKKDHIMKTPAIIARKTGTPVLPAFIKRTKNGHLIEIGEEIELDTAENDDNAVYNDTVKFSGKIEEYIKENPAEWLWMHRRWKRIHD
ncbi:MAG: lipid A biosynthesis acyltransferase [Nitrospiraceae bacterium]|jgi:Kdo2-lipid IVA lauroyltransferase/acyltransferase|nr:MAG: lipid A biosynthesis acyltransferase [Nitrospiraceae bacterium]